MSIKLLESSESVVTTPPARPPLHVVPQVLPSAVAPNAVGRAADGPVVVMVDEPWPEFVSLMQGHLLPGDTLCVPMASNGPLRQDQWPLPSGIRVHAASLLACLRRQELEQAQTPAARLRAQVRYDALLARAYLPALASGVRHVVVSQNLLPFAWEAGALRHRSFDVLMTRLPLANLDVRVAQAQRRHPTNAMLYMHRADSRLVALETHALGHARRLITPHAEVAEVCGTKAVLLPWCLPQVARTQPGSHAVFPVDVGALEGAYEVRAMARNTGTPITLVDPRRGSQPFWRGVQTRGVPGDAWLRNAAVVVQPAWVCEQPRRLLEAVAAGIPVVATRACGLPLRSVFRLVTPDDTAGLAAGVRAALARAH